MLICTVSYPFSSDDCIHFVYTCLGQSSYHVNVYVFVFFTDVKPAERVLFKASHLLNRKKYFHNSLIHIVKQHHKVKS